MKHVFLLFVCALFMSATAFAQTKAASSIISSAGPKMSLKSETVDYGTIKKGSDRIRTIEFTNTGNEPLIINNCKGSCGCTVPTCPKEPIMPGKSGKIEVNYDTERLGPINKVVTISIEGQAEPVRVTLVGKVTE